MPRLAGVGVNVVAATYSAQRPTIIFQELNELFAVHGSYYNHQ